MAGFFSAMAESRKKLKTSNVFSPFTVCKNRNRSAPVRELLSNNSLFVSQLYDNKSLALRARDLIIFTTDLQTIITQQFTAGADLFLKYWYETCDVFVPIFTRCEELVPIFHCVKFAKCEICGSTERSGSVVECLTRDRRFEPHCVVLTGRKQSNQTKYTFYGCCSISVVT